LFEKIDESATTMLIKKEGRENYHSLKLIEEKRLNSQSRFELKAKAQFKRGGRSLLQTNRNLSKGAAPDGPDQKGGQQVGVPKKN